MRENQPCCVKLALGKTEKQVRPSSWITQVGGNQRHRWKRIHFARTVSLPVLDVSMQRAMWNSHKTRFMMTYKGLLLKRKTGERGVQKKNTAWKQGDGRPLLSYAATRSAQSVHKHTPNSGLVSQTGFTQKRKKKKKTSWASVEDCTGVWGASKKRTTATLLKTKMLVSPTCTKQPNAGNHRNGEMSGLRNVFGEKGRSLCS